LDVKLISPDQAHRLHPFFQPEGVRAVMWVPDDLYFDPTQVAIGFVRAAEAHGVITLRIPLVPTRHQLFVTEPIEGARADLPMVRIMDAAVYVRPCDGGFLWGAFEEGPQQL